MQNSGKLSNQNETTPSLKGVKAKLEQALKHASLIDEIYKDWRRLMVESPPIDFPISQTTGALIFNVKAHLPDSRMSLILGDFIHNLRTCLNHMTGQLAMIDGHDVLERSSLEFPIFIDRSAYKKDEDRKIGKYIKNTEVLGAIEALQPYHDNNPKNHPLWLLSELDNIDKHRTLVLVAPRINRKVEPALVSRPAGNRQVLPESANRYTLGFQIEIQPNNPVFTNNSATNSMELWIDTTIVLTGTRLVCDTWPVQETIRILSTRVEKIIQEFEKRFF